MNKEDVEKLVHCLNALIIMRKAEPSLSTALPGLDNIIANAKEALYKNPFFVPEWFDPEFSERLAKHIRFTYTQP